MEVTRQKNKPAALTVLFFSSLFFIGMFHEFISCIYGVCFAMILFCKTYKKGHFTAYVNAVSVAVGAICLFYLLSMIWAVDSGMAFIGFFKYLPLGLFLLCLMDDPKVAGEIHRGLPYVTAIMTVISILCMQLPFLNGYFIVSDRLAGFFQYPNTFAMLLLVAELLIIQKECLKKIDFGVIGVLVVGILMSGSRTVFALAVLANLMMLLSCRNRWTKRGMIVSALVGMFSIGVGVFMMFQYDVLHRLAEFSLSESTFLGRFLYFQDALPIILKHPLGLGLNGYYYLQPSFQTGVYIVKFVHNDFLQLMLDIGWIPALLLLYALGKTLLNRENSLQKKIILGALLIHCCFDFDLQYISMFCLLLSFLDFEYGRKWICEGKPLGLIKLGCILIMAVCVYMSAALCCAYLGLYGTSHQLYPWNTENEMNLLTEFEDPVELEMLADEILQRNPNVLLAWAVKNSLAYQNGDFSSVIQYKNYIFDIAPFSYEEYEEYCQMLVNGIEVYLDIGDKESADICMEELIHTKERLEALPGRLSKLGKSIVDQPKIKLPKEIEQYIENYE